MASRLADMGWHDFVHHQRQTSLHPTIKTAPHPAAPYLHHLSLTGVPAPSQCSPWSHTDKCAAFTRGPHPSAAHVFPQFLLEDMWDYIQMGYWTVLPFSAVQHFPHLKLAPSGVVPQRDRRPRPIMDYTFNGVNNYTVPIAPVHSMQFGHALQRLLQRLVYSNPLYGPPLMMKVDLDDGYYRIPLSSDAALQLAVVLPPDNTKENLVGIPLSLPMGWRDSPPYFCAFTESVADMANCFLTRHNPYHPLETIVQTTPFPSDDNYAPSAILPNTHNIPPTALAYIDVYIDDFIAIAQRPMAKQAMRALFHSMDHIFRDNDSTIRRNVVSTSKIDKGDAAWNHQKQLLGWNIDTINMTIQLPLHRAERLQKLLKHYTTVKRTSRRRWQGLLGELRSMAPALHSTKYLFSLLQHVLVDQRSHLIRINKNIKQSLYDWHAIARDLTEHPVPLAHLVPLQPSFIGTTDASKYGMGGIWWPMPSSTKATPIIWRVPFPPAVTNSLVSTTNPNGHLTNSDLELAAVITGATIATQYSQGEPTSLLCATDNTPTLAWCTKGSTSSNTAAAYLLRSLAQSARTNNFVLNTVFTPGITNTIADFCSRSFHLTDSAFLAVASQRFGQHSWILAQPANAWTSLMNSSLSKQMPPWASQLGEPGPLITPGASGKTSATRLTKTPTFTLRQIPSPSYNYSPENTGMEAWLPVVLRSAREQWKGPFAPLGRRWPHWDCQTHGCNPGKLDLRLQRQLKAYNKIDPPPTRVKPIPLPVIAQAAHLSYLANTPQSNAVGDMLIIGFYFLLRPGEYAKTENPESTPFRFCDVHVVRGVTRLNTLTASDMDLQSATTAALEFTNQKNGVRGELVGLARSGDPRWCPVLALINRIRHLRLHTAAQTTPIYAYHNNGTWLHITASHLTFHLRQAVAAWGAPAGIKSTDISVRSLRSSGAMALLCAAVDTDIIRLLGRWRSDEMLRYLHVQALPIVAPLATQMLRHGNFTLIPNNTHLNGE